MHTEEGAARQKKQEQRVARALEAAGIEYRREHHIDFSCIDSNLTFARIDFVVLCGGRVIFLEVDENQHRFGYDSGQLSCDMRRMARVVESLALEGNALPIEFVRYNPDAFRVDGALQRIPKKDRERILVDYLTSITDDGLASEAAPLTITYFCYDCEDLLPTVCADHGYDPHLRQCVQVLAHRTGLTPPHSVGITR